MEEILSKLAIAGYKTTITVNANSIQCTIVIRQRGDDKGDKLSSRFELRKSSLRAELYQLAQRMNVKCDP